MPGVNNIIISLQKVVIAMYWGEGYWINQIQYDPNYNRIGHLNNLFGLWEFEH